MRKILFAVCLLTLAAAIPGAARAQVVSNAEAYKAIVKINTFVSGADGFLTNFQSGTGVIIDEKGIILTNEHVVTVQYSYDESESDVGHQICITTEIAKEPDCSYTAKVIAADKTLDLALLQIVPIAGLSSQTSFPYIEPLQSGVAALNEEVNALGYPAVGGNTISVTKGIISGKQDKYDVHWLKTDAVTSFGSSGGALINSAGKLVGITTEVHSDLAGTLGYAVDVGSVMPWVNIKKAQAPVADALQDRMIAFTRKQSVQNASSFFLFDGYDLGISKPSGWTFKYTSEDRLLIFDPNDDSGGWVGVALSHFDFPVPLDYIDLQAKIDLTDKDEIAQASFIKDDAVTLNGVPAKHLKIGGVQDVGEQYFLVNKDIAVQLVFGYGKNDKDIGNVNLVLNSVTINQRPQPVLLTQFSNPKPVFSFATNSDWYIRKLDGRRSPFELYAKDFTARVEVNIEKKTEQTGDLSNDQILALREKGIENANAAAKDKNLTVVLKSGDAHARLSDQAADTIQFEALESNLATSQRLVYFYAVTIPLPDDYISLTMRYYGSDQAAYDKKLASLKSLLSTFSLTANPAAAATAPSQPASSAPSAAGSYDPAKEKSAAVSIGVDKKLAPASGSTACTPNSLIKGRSSRAVYYCGVDGRRYVFPNQQTFMTWYDNFDSVVTVSDEALADIRIGGVVTYRPGTRMLKITSDPKVYAVSADGVLHPIGSEAAAARLFGPDWNKMIDDISDAYFVNYKVGDPIN